MPDIFVMKTTYERNANDGIQHFTQLDRLAVAVLEAQQNEALKVQVFRCVEVSFNAYWQIANIEIGADKKGT